AAPAAAAQTPHSRSSSMPGPDVLPAVLPRDGDKDALLSGFNGLTVLKATESGFVGYPKDKYTTLPETDDRILAPDIATRWIYNSTDLDFESVYTRVKEIILDSFTDHFSHA